MIDHSEEGTNLGMPDQEDALALPEAAADEASAVEASLRQTVGELQLENSDLRDKLLRTIAEMENFRRRTERERTDGMKYAVSEFARDAVTIGDNLRRAIEAVRKEPLDENPALKTLLEGVEVTERDLIKVLERHGITRFDPVGEKFDPHVHEAMIKVDVPNVAADIIVQVLQAGYRIADRVLRPAAVIVAKGGTITKPSAKPDSFDDEKQPDGKEPPIPPSRAQHPSSQEGQPDGTLAHAADTIAQGASRPNKEIDPLRREKPPTEKRASSVTKPVTEGSGPSKKDDLISSFGKRLESGN